MRIYALAFLAALTLHAALLFAFHLREARAFAVSEEPAGVEVSLEEGPPEAAPAATEPEPPEVEPEPEPEVAPPPPEPETMPAPSALPEPPRVIPVKSARSKAAGTPRSTANAGSPGAPGTGAGRGINTGAKPRYRFNPKPEYPAEARQKRQQGVVLLTVDVTAGGSAGEVGLARSSGYPALDQAALQAVRRWTFEPARAWGVAVASKAAVPVRFTLPQ